MPPVMSTPLLTTSGDPGDGSSSWLLREDLDRWTDRVEMDLNRTNNFSESFDKTFADDVGHYNRTIFNILSAVLLEQAYISCYRQGSQPPKKKKICVEKDVSMEKIVRNLHHYENRVLEYLDELAEL